MAPDVSVPANFGRHHIGAPSHGNLTFNMKEGAPIKANSIILSLNSPVIDNLTTNLHMTSVDVEDFSREAVDCFIEASYTGELEEVNVRNFRDLNKMSHVFEVSWLVAQCQEFFVSHLGNLNRESSYDDILFAVEEAIFVMSVLKEPNFLELVVPKLNSTFFFISQRDIILNQLLSDFQTITKFQLDACIAIAQTDIHLLIENLLAHFETHEPQDHLEPIVRHLLKNIDLNICFRKKPDVHEKLFSILGDLTLTKTEDYQLIVSLLERKRIGKIQSAIVSKSFGRYIDADLGFNDVFDKLSSDRDVLNLYDLFEGLWLRLFFKKDEFESNIVNKISDLKSERGWCKMDNFYINNIFDSSHFKQATKFLGLVKNCENLVHEEKESSTYTIIHEYTGNQFLPEIIFKDNAFMFRLLNGEHPGKQLVFLSKSMRNHNPKSFSMSYYAADTFLNHSQPGMIENCPLPNLHFALQTNLINDKPFKIFPISWCGYPTHNKEMNYWEWGYMRSSPTRPGDMLPENEFIWGHFVRVSSNSDYRLVCFQIT